MHLCVFLYILRPAGKNNTGVFDAKHFLKERIKMNECKANHCIECEVVSCKNHCGSENYCALDKIKVGTHECNPTMDQCTDCLSFELK